MTGIDGSALGDAVMGTRAFTYSALTMDEHRDLIERAVRAYLSSAQPAADALAPLAGEAGEVVAWQHPTAGWVAIDRDKIAAHCTADETPRPLYAHPAPPAPAAMPGVERAAETMWQAESDSVGSKVPWSDEHQVVKQRYRRYATAILALFPPQAQENADRDGEWACVVNQLEDAVRTSEARAIAAEQALATVREECAKVALKFGHDADFYPGFQTAVAIASAIRAGDKG